MCWLMMFQHTKVAIWFVVFLAPMWVQSQKKSAQNPSLQFQVGSPDCKIMHKSGNIKQILALPGFKRARANLSAHKASLCPFQSSDCGSELTIAPDTMTKKAVTTGRSCPFQVRLPTQCEAH